MKMKRSIARALALAAALTLCLTAISCSSPDTGTASAYQSYLFMTDTWSGGIYYYDPSTQTASSQSLLSVGQNATAEIQFYKGKGYVTVGDDTLGNTCGLYAFNPDDASPSAARIGDSLSAQFVAFSSSTKAYLSVANYSSPDKDGVYSFNPSDASAGLSLISATHSAKAYPQEMAIGSDGMLYVANSDSLGDAASVSRIDPSDNSIKATIATTNGGTTGLYAGTYNGAAGVFVANSYGSIDFIKNSGDAATTVISGIYPTRVLQLSNGNLAATGWSNTYYVSLSGATASVSELKDSGNSYGGTDIAYKDGLVYVSKADYSKAANKLFVYDESGNAKDYSPVSVMNGGGLTLANIGFYQD